MTNGIALVSPVVISRRWDGLGARLTALTNAWSLARTLQLDFQFIWPHSDTDPFLNLQDLFTQDFRREFERSQIEAGTPVPVIDGGSGSALEIRRRLLAGYASSFVEVSEWLNVLVFAGEHKSLAVDRFRRSFMEIGWNERMRQIIEFFANWRDGEQYHGVHIRAGDVVTGVWRHVIAYAKYIPTPYVLFAVEKLAATDGNPLLVVSDNDEYITFLKSRCGAIRTPRDILPTYDDLTGTQRAMVDILALSRCAGIIAARGSAFGGLAASLGPLSITAPDAILPSGREGDVLLQGIDEELRDLTSWPFLRPFLARDICLYLNVFGNSLPADVQIRMASQAVDLDPQLCTARCWLARSAARTRQWRRARSTARRALRIAKSVRIQVDPLVDALSTSVVVACLLAISKIGDVHHIERHARQDLGALANLRRPFRLISAKLLLMMSARELAEASRLTPYWMDQTQITTNLRYQLGAASLLARRAGDWETETAARILATGEPSSRDFRIFGLDDYRADILFDPLLRDLERLSLRFSRAFGTTIGCRAENGTRSITGHVERISVSASGLQWIEGWAADYDTENNVFAVAVRGDGLVYGGPVSIMRKDVAAAVGHQAAEASGFSFPVPHHVKLAPNPGPVEFLAVTKLGIQRITLNAALPTVAAGTSAAPGKP